MEKQYFTGAENAAALMEQVSSLLTLSLQDVKRKYANDSGRVTEYAGKEEGERLLEIRLDKAEVTVTCAFNPCGVCKSVYLFPDDNRFIRRLTAYMSDAYDYEFDNKRWVGPHGYIVAEPSPFCDGETFLRCYR
ncbi:MAG: hypothetical protein LIP00_09460 [Parabacteroides sp.]|nr:hypothetical protein [Parabacteroides sp.]